MQRVGKDTVTQLLYRIDEAAKLLAISRSAVYELISSGQLRKLKIGSRSCIAAAELHRFIETRMQEVA